MVEFQFFPVFSSDTDVATALEVARDNAGVGTGNTLHLECI